MKRKRTIVLITALSLLLITCLALSVFAQGPKGPTQGPPPGPPPGTMQQGGINQALDMCYANCTRDLQMCLRPTLTPGFDKRSAAGMANSCTDRVKPCMMNCVR